ncbi:MAG: hypothetical protein QHI48_08735 [Bacteroidota bacterium]|nr:hypothetical protein [Bacteroidota bacterium]
MLFSQIEETRFRERTANTRTPTGVRKCARIFLLPAALFLHTAMGTVCAQGQEINAAPSKRLGTVFRQQFVAHAHDTLRLEGKFIIPSSDTLLVDSAVLFIAGTDYELDARNGLVVLTDNGCRRLDTSIVHRFDIVYTALAFHSPLSFRLRKLVERRDSASRDSVKIAVPSSPLTIDNIFGGGLRKSGYLGRGFTIGTNRDMTLNSGFRLQLAGKLAENVDLVAALTDENTPIQPEGNTRTIQELDKVFVRIAGPRLAATLGDFAISLGSTEFGVYGRKLSGILAEGSADAGALSLSYASMKGTYRTMQFNGVDGVQGPYRLTGKNGQPRIVVLAGTERVYIDGVLMQRGEMHDYVIEYASGEITFTPNRLITSASRITVDFEYAERRYERSMFAVDGSAKVAADRLSLTARYIRESDDPDAPIDFDLGPAERAVLTAAGDDPAKAVLPGAVYVGIDSSRGRGAGQYILTDTLVDGTVRSVFRYDPGADSATYVVTFSYVGPGKGDYARQSVGFYRFVGVGKGDYAPVRLLSPPQLHQLVDVKASGEIVRRLTLTAEAALSDAVQNRFSTADAGDNTGTAANVEASWSSPIGAAGVLDVRARFRTLSSSFSPIDRIDEIEFSRRWDLPSAARTGETLREGSLIWRPWSRLIVRGGGGMYTSGSFSSRRIESGLTLAQDSSLPSADWSAEWIRSDDHASRGRWFRQRGEIVSPPAFIQPSFRFEHERRWATAGPADTLTPSALAFYDLQPALRTREFWNMALTADWGFRVDEAPVGGRLERQSVDYRQRYGWILHPWHDLSASGSVTIRERRWSEAFRRTGNADFTTVLTRGQIAYTPFRRAVSTDILYEASTERSAKLERIFLKVPIGQGNYIYAGDKNGNGIADEDEYTLTRFDGEYIALTLPTDELFPVVDLRVNARLQLRPSLALPTSDGVLRTVLRAISTETQVRIDEKSSTERTTDIYLLRLSSFLDDSTTINGAQRFRQDLFLFERSPDLSLRFRYEASRGFTRYAAANERSTRIERSVRLRSYVLREFGVQADLAFRNDDVSSSIASSRARAIRASVFNVDWSYTPSRTVECGFVLGFTSAEDTYPGREVTAGINAQTLRTAVSFGGPGRLRIELERNEVTLSSNVVQFPFELTEGRAVGKSWILRVQFDYRITSFLQATTTYLGRTEGGGPFLHTAKAEVRAFF